MYVLKYFASLCAIDFKEQWLAMTNSRDNDYRLVEIPKLLIYCEVLSPKEHQCDKGCY